MNDLQSLLDAIQDADFLSLDDVSRIDDWYIGDITGDPDHEILVLTWEEECLELSTAFTEGALQSATVDKTIKAQNIVGDLSEISLHVLKPLHLHAVSGAPDAPDTFTLQEPEHRFMAYLTADTLAGRDWHRLSQLERDLVSLLEKEGYLTPAAHGFVGQPAHKL